MRVPIDFDSMKEGEILELAKKAIYEFNNKSIFQFKIVKKDGKVIK